MMGLCRVRSFVTPAQRWQARREAARVSLGLAPRNTELNADRAAEADRIAQADDYPASEQPKYRSRSGMRSSTDCAA